jgi:predicted SAM-dependent methyltransferase
MKDETTTENPLKIHLGCGPRHISGFLHVDLLQAPHVDHVADVRNLGFLKTGTVDLVYACHVLEHFGRREVADVLAEWARVLKPGGILRLSVPDFAACAKLYYEQGLQDGLTGLIGLISGGQRDEYDFHKIIFDQPFLTAALNAAGFDEVRLWDWRTTEHSNVDDFSQAYIPHMDKDNGLLMSLNIEGVKRR